MTTNTAALLRHLATILDILGAHRDANEGRDVWPSGLAFAGDRLGVAMGLDIEATWQEVATALRAHADSLAPGLPEGWALNDRGTGTPEYVRYSVHGPGLAFVVLHRSHDGRVAMFGDAAPPAVYAYLLARAQGVGS